MHPHKRHIILLIFIILFLISAPIILLYTAGFRYNFKKHKIEQVGAFIFVTKPEKVTITVDEKKLKKTGDILIENFKPDVHEVKIEKANYHTWKNNLLVKPNLTTFVEGIRLFKKSIPELLINKSLTKIEYSPDKKQFIAQSDNKLIHYDLSNKLEKQILKIPQNYILENIDWNKSSTKILITLKHTKNQKKLFHVTSVSKLSNQTNLSSQDIIKYQWTQFSDDIFGFTKNKIIKIKTSDFTDENLFTTLQEIISFEIINQNLFVLLNDPENHQNRILKISLYDKEIIEPIATLPSSKHYSMKYLNINKLLVKDSKNQIIYFIDPNQQKNQPQIIGILPNYQNCIEKSTSNLICFNDFEMISYHLSNNKKELISRFSSPIQYITPFIKSNHVTFHLNNSIKIIDTQSNFKKTIINLTSELNNISNIHINKNETTLYFYSEIGNSKGLYQLEL